MFALFSYFDFTDANNWNKYLPDFLQKLQEEVDHAAASGNQDDEQRKGDSEAAAARTSPMASQLQLVRTATSNVPGEPSSASAAEEMQGRWLELRKAIPGAEEEQMSLQEFWALDSDDIKKLLSNLSVAKLGKLKLLHQQKPAGRS